MEFRGDQLTTIPSESKSAWRLALLKSRSGLRVHLLYINPCVLSRLRLQEQQRFLVSASRRQSRLQVRAFPLRASASLVFAADPMLMHGNTTH